MKLINKISLKQSNKGFGLLILCMQFNSSWNEKFAQTLVKLPVWLSFISMQSACSSFISFPSVPETLFTDILHIVKPYNKATILLSIRESLFYPVGDILAGDRWNICIVVVHIQR